MTTAAQEQKKELDLLDLAYKVVMAVLATMAVVRSAQNAGKAWQRVLHTVRPPEEPAELSEPGPE